MNLHYYRDTGALYIDLAASPSADSREIASGLVVDFDENGNVVGLDIQHASQRLDLSEIATDHLPLLISA